ncbi:MAG: flagellar hook-basal body complex protein FliE [Deltaproteobacteria bacterium]|nr:MAG: flagellar hook-basal body complex protein FliE [Deltaproteobacteria bacterium]
MKITATDPNWVNLQENQGLKGPGGEKEFGHLLSGMVNEVNKLQQESNKKIEGSLLGQEDLHETMLSLEKSSLGLKLLLQVRNKMIQAYEELSRMPL